MVPDDDTKIQILHEHYKDSFAQLQKSIKLRDKLFLLILVTVTIMLFQIYSPKEFGSAISQFITKQLESEKQNVIDLSFISSIIWFGLFALVVRYYQTVMYIERQYKYIHKLEEQISPTFKNIVFTREGEHYLSNFWIFSEWVWIIYMVIFPILMITVISIKIVSEYLENSHLFIFDTIIFLFILISTILYMIAIHIKTKKEDTEDVEI